MSVNGITNGIQTYDKVSSKRQTPSVQTPEETNDDQNSVAAVYEKSEQSPEPKVYKQDIATVDRLKSEAERRYQTLRDLIQKLLLKQGQKVEDGTDLYAMLREGKVQVDPETREQAQKDIAEDGYWGVEQTSERMISFAKALAGGDPSKADELIEGVKKGFKEATKAWGGTLPDICQKTLDTAIAKLEAWRDGKENK